MLKDYLISNNVDFFDNISSSNQKSIKNIKSSDKNTDIISIELTNKKDNLFVINHIYTDYTIYKKKLIKNIIEDINLFNDFFNDDINEILINIKILKKKNKIDEVDYQLFEPIYEFVFMLEKIKKIDQEDFLLLTVIFFKINILVTRIQLFFNNFIFKDLINYELLIEKIINLNKILVDRNYFLKKFYELTNTNKEEDLKKKLSEIAHILATDFFMYYNSENIFNKIINCILIKNPHQIVFQNKKNFKRFLKKLIKNKEVFLNEYDKRIKIYKEIYGNLDLESKIKCILKKNHSISKFIEDLNYIKNIE